MPKKICPRCNGNGYFKVKKEVKWPSKEEEIVVQCPQCNSEGEIEEDVDLSLDTVSIISNEVNDMKELNEEQKTKLKLMIRDLYMESLSV